jgi:hypothetical protein
LPTLDSPFRFGVIMENINRRSLHELLCRRQFANIERSLAITWRRSPPGFTPVGP